MVRNKNPEETIQKILDAALKLFLEKGYEETTILDIVNETGELTRGAFYYHFKSKEEVLDALGLKLFQLDNPFKRAKKRPDLNGLEKIKFVLVTSFNQTDLQKLNMQILHLLNSPRFLKQLIDDNRDLVAPLFQELIEEGMADGSIQTIFGKELAEIFTYLTNFWTIPTIYPCSQGENRAKILFIKELTDKLGMPVIDETFLAKYDALEVELTEQ